MTEFLRFLIGLFIIICSLALGLLSAVYLEVVLYNNIETFYELPIVVYYVFGGAFGVIGLALARLIKIGNK